MPLNTKIIKRRIKSVNSTKKITKAMEMISVVKMKRAVANVLSTRSYANLAWGMLTEIAEKTDIKHHPLLIKREVKKIGLILVASNRGLAGGFSSRLLQEVHRYITNLSETSPNLSIACPAERGEERKPSPLASAEERAGERSRTGISVEIILSGRQGRKIYYRFSHNVVAEFEKIDLTTKIEEILPMARLVIEDYIKGRYDKIVIAYTDYFSALRQIPRIKQILPFKRRDEFLGEIKEAETSRHLPKIDEFQFEPGTKEVLEVLLPRLAEMQIYQAILESDASEHSARMMAMRNASDAAADMIKELNYSFNKARQAAITQEISEIVGGTTALG